MRTFVTSEKMIDYPVPQLTPEKKRAAPAFVLRLQVTKSADRAGTEYAFLVARNLKIPLESFTVSYEYTYLDPETDEHRQASGEIRYADADINRSNFIVCRINDTNTVLSNGFQVRVTEAAAEDGTEYVYGDGDFLADTENDRALRYSYAGENAPSSKSGERDGPKKEKKAKKPGSRLAHTLVALAAVLAGLLVACLLVFAVFFGFHYVMYNYLMPEADALVVAGRQDLAEDYVDRYLANNYFFRMYRDEVTETVGRLSDEGRHNEAYAVSKNAPFVSLTKQVAAKALEAALERKDYREAYAYAASLDGEYANLVARSAAAHLTDGDGSEWNEEAASVALKADDGEVSDLVAHDLALWYWNRGEKAHARAAVGRITDEGLRAEWEELFRQEEFAAVLATKDTAYILAYLDAHENVPERDGFLAEYRGKRYDEFVEAGEWRKAFAYAAEYGFDTAELVNDPSIVREALGEAYFLQSPAQMRRYHAETVSAADMIVSVQNGKVSWVDGGKVLSVSGAVSVSAGEYVTSILLNDGTVRAYANRAAGNPLTVSSVFENGFIAGAQKLQDVVAMSSGERHTAYLHADGTVTVIGDNEYGQADTARWTDIVAVAAGRRFTAGLCSDGTIVACGSNAAGQCEVGGYRNAVDIRACSQSLVVLFRDGTLAVAGDRSMGLADAEDLYDVEEIRARQTSVIARLKDGTFRMCGGPAEGSNGSVAEWRDVMDFAVGDGFVCRQSVSGSVYSNGENVPVNP